MDRPAAVSALMNGSVDAVLVAAGEANRAVKAGGRVLPTGEDSLRNNCSCSWRILKSIRNWYSGLEMCKAKP